MTLPEHSPPTSSGVQPSSVSRRRILLRGVLYALGGAAAGRLVRPERAFAADKVSKQQAGYQDSAKGDNRCDKCEQFQPPASCKLVEGAVSPSGYCNFFARKPG